MVVREEEDEVALALALAQHSHMGAALWTDRLAGTGCEQIRLSHPRAWMGVDPGPRPYLSVQFSSPQLVLFLFLFILQDDMTPLTFRPFLRRSSSAVNMATLQCSWVSATVL